MRNCGDAGKAAQPGKPRPYLLIMASPLREKPWLAPPCFPCCAGDREVLYIHCTSGQTSRQSSCSPLHQQILYFMPYPRTLVPSCFPEKCGKRSSLSLLLEKKHRTQHLPTPVAWVVPFSIPVTSRGQSLAPLRALSSATARAGGRQGDRGPLQPHQLANHRNVFPEHSRAKSKGVRGEGMVLVRSMNGEEGRAALCH